MSATYYPMKPNQASDISMTIRVDNMQSPPTLIESKLLEGRRKSEQTDGKNQQMPLEKPLMDSSNR